MMASSGRKVVALLLLLLAVGSACFAQQTITVPDDYPTIQAATNAASPGDTVYIKAGRYIENFTIDKPLHLTGEDRLKVIIQSPDVKKDVITVDLSHGIVEIEGIEVTGGGTGIYAKIAEDAQVKLSSIISYKNQFGILAMGNGDLSLTKSYFVDNQIGLAIAASTAG